ncbi:MAG: outer membrane lipoprotein carrier protein LolA [Bacteroidales bacterium]|nr:outer membrane lipoprotein carrier protein LolA [Bacteroidales bacterium]
MKTIIICFVIYFLNVMIALPQSDPTPDYKEIDPKAKSILDKVSQKNKSYKTIKSDFAIILENKRENIKDAKKGVIWIKGNKYKIDLAQSTIFFDGTTQWTYIKESNEVNITSPDPKDDNTLNPAKIFTLYETGFKIRFIRERFEKNRALYEIELYPKDLNKDFTKINLKIDKDKNQIFSMKRFGKDGTDFYIEIISVKANEEMADAMFVFDKSKYPKVEINDLRE